MIIKGYRNSDKTETAGTGEVNVRQAGYKTTALVTYNISTAYAVATDTTEAGSTTKQIVATSHSATVGDIIRITSVGAYQYKEASVIEVVDADNFIVDKEFAAALGSGIDFSILRPMTPAVDSSGAMVTSITLANDTNYGAVGASTLRTAAQIGNATGAADFGAGAVSAQTVRTTPASDSAHLLNTRHETATTPLSVRVTNGTAFYDGATETTAAAILADTAAMDANLVAIAADTASMDTNITAILADTANIDTNVATITSNSTAILADTAAIDTNVAGIKSDTTAILADTANIDTNVAAILADTANMDTNIAAILADTAAMDTALAELNAGLDSVDTYTRDYASSGLSAATWTEIIASTSAECKEIEIFDSSGEILELGTGTAASEVRQMYIFPGGNGRVRLKIASGTRVAIKCASAVSTGNFIINTYG